MPEINIPFPGLYESYLSHAITDTETSEVEHIHESQAGNYPAPLHLSESDITDEFWHCVNYSIAHEHMARVYLEAFDAWAGEALGEARPAWRDRYDFETRRTTRERYRADSCGMRWSLMTSPREYNFETDRLFVTVSWAFIKRLWKMSRDDSHDTLRRVIKERFTSYDGFISHYRNTLEAWGPLDEWDYNQLGTLLVACLEISGADDESLMYDCIEGESGYEAFNAALDYDGLKEALAEKRAVLLEEWAETDPTACAAWLEHNAEKAAPILKHADMPDDMPDGDACGSFYRCKVTPDLFEGTTL